MTTQPPDQSRPPGPPQGRPSGPPQGRPSGLRKGDRALHIRDGRVAARVGLAEGTSPGGGGYALASRARRSTTRTSTSSDASSPTRPRSSPAGRRACAPSARGRSPAPSSARATSPCSPTRDTIAPVERVPSASANTSGAPVRRARNRPRTRRKLAFHLCWNRSRRLPRVIGLQGARTHLAQADRRRRSDHTCRRAQPRRKSLGS